MRLLSIGGAFILAMWAVGDGWAALRAAWAAPTGAGLLAVAGYAAVLLAAVAYLGYWVYAADRAAGRVQRPIGLYERVLQRRRRHA